MSEVNPETGPLKPYGPPIQDAIASGDTLRMRQASINANQWLARNEGDPSAPQVRAALADLDNALHRLG